MDKSDINFVAKVVASKKYVKQWLPFVVVSLVVFIAVIALLMSYLPINIFAVITPIVALALLVAVTLGVGIFLRLTNHCIPIDKWRCFIAPCLVAIIFAVALVNVFIPNAKAYSAINSDYSLSNNELTLERYKGKDEELNLSSTITWNRRERALKAIGAKAFAYSSIKKISIPDSVTSIGDFAFVVCRELASITIPSSVTSIGNYTLQSCSALTSVTIPSSVTSIGDGAFSNCSALTSITIPNSVTSIGEGAFRSCSALTSITIPNSVTSIGREAFNRCSALTSVTIPSSVTSIGKEAFYNCSALTSITIPSSVTSIGDGAFNGCKSLTSITIPSSVTSIGIEAFSGCQGLTTINVDNNNQKFSSINGNLYSKKKTVLIRYAIGKSNTSFAIPSSVTSIGYYAFNGCKSLTSITNQVA